MNKITSGAAMTPKGERTRQHIVDVAMARFERDGFGATTMRGIATEAGVSVGLAYRYFDSKEGIVLVFYEAVARDLAAHQIEGTTLGARFADVMHTKLALLSHRRRAMGSLIAAMLDPDGPVGLLSPGTAEIRQTTRDVLRAAVAGSPGLPEGTVEPLVRIGWIGHALLMLAWVQRPAATEGLVDQVASALDRIVPFLGLPMASAALAAVVHALAAFEGQTA